MANVSYNLFSSRDFFPLEDALKRTSEHGCKEAQIASGYYLKDTPAETEKAVSDIVTCLRANNLTVPVIHTSIDHYKNRTDDLIETSKILGCTALILPYVQPDDRPTTAKGWYDFARDLQSHVKPFLDAGITIGWHNHHFEFFPIDGVYPMDEIFRGFPELKFEMDMAWVEVAKVDPVELIKKYQNRLFALHVKDRNPKGQNEDQGEWGWCNIGDGIVPISDVLKESNKNPAIKYFILEHDNPKCDVEYLSASVPKLKQLLAQAGY